MGTVKYQVRFVEDSGLPDGINWAFARTVGDTYLFVKQSAIDPDTGRCDALNDAWKVWLSVSPTRAVGQRPLALSASVRDQRSGSGA